MRHARAYPSEQGSVLVLALLVTLVILGIGITVMWVSTSGMKVSSNLARRQEALYAAEVGIERGRALLNTLTDWTPVLNGTACTPALAVGAFDQNKGFPLCVGVDKLQGLAFVAAPAVARDDRAGAKMNYTVWVRNDWTVECDTKASKAKDVICGLSGTKGHMSKINMDNNSRVILRAEGVGRDGLSYVALEAVVSRGIGLAGGQCMSQEGGCGGQGTNAIKAALSN